MTFNSAPWESRLLEWAHQGSQSTPVENCVGGDSRALKEAYRRCADITRTHSRTFYLASGLLPRPKCRSVRALYAFCRITDDLVDAPGRHTPNAAPGDLDGWRQRTTQECPEAYETVALAWNDTQFHYRIPRLYAKQLMDGVTRDLQQTRYTTFEELTVYCYGVASTVGLMSMHIIGFDSPNAIPYAVKLGVALQLTNILRDVREDWNAGRLYLPLAELADFGLTEADIAAGRVDDRWRAFMRFQIDRVRRLYAESLPGLAYLHADGRFAINAAAELYRAILEVIEAHDMENMYRRAYVGAWGKVRRLPGIWWGARHRHAPL